MKKYIIESKIDLLAFLSTLKNNKDISVNQYNFDLRKIKNFYSSLPIFDLKNIKNRRTIEEISDELIDQLQKCQDDRRHPLLTIDKFIFISHIDRFDGMLIGKMLSQIRQNNIYAQIELGKSMDKFRKVFYHNSNQ